MWPRPRARRPRSRRGPGGPRTAEGQTRGRLLQRLVGLEASRSVPSLVGGAGRPRRAGVLGGLRWVGEPARHHRPEDRGLLDHLRHRVSRRLALMSTGRGRVCVRLGLARAAGAEVCRGATAPCRGRGGVGRLCRGDDPGGSRGAHCRPEAAGAAGVIPEAPGWRRGSPVTPSSTGASGPAGTSPPPHAWVPCSSFCWVTSPPVCSVPPRAGSASAAANSTPSAVAEACSKTPDTTLWHPQPWRRRRPRPWRAPRPAGGPATRRGSPASGARPPLVGGRGFLSRVTGPRCAR